ncbi:MAG: type II toxin-antitoxin system death-on-curing family toxin [Bdellovibrionales bacterium]|nr:type II toxin-antitoxin system death-on-curing family toxin [Bdellovibrionales bacterium]
MKTTIFLSVEEILNLHERTIKKHGGKPGVRDLGLVESAVYRCQSGYYNSLSEQAASLMQSLCMNHCFVDGNKRVALLATVVFLKMNGYNLKCRNKTIVKFIVEKVIVKKADVTQIANWLSKKIEER